MRLSRVRTIPVVLSLVTVAFAIAACATAPIDDSYSGLTQEQKPTQAEQTTGATLPAPSSSTAPSDAGTTPTATDAATTTKDASPPVDSGAPTPVDSGSTPTAVDCDPADPTYYLKFLTSAPSTCPCGVGQCCYFGLGCVAQ